MVALSAKPELNALSDSIEIDGERYVPATVIARELGVSRQTLWRWRRDGTIPQGHVHRRRRLMFTADECRRIAEHANRIEPARSKAGG